jgi:type II secretory pathway pseudopilin PulG
LVCLAVVGVAGASVVRSALAQHRSSLQHERRLQALWLAESAIEHFQSQPAASAEESEQTWTPPGGAGVVRARIVSDDSDDSSPRRVAVEARWPDESPESVVHRREFTLSR